MRRQNLVVMTVKNICDVCGKPIDPNNLGRSVYELDPPQELVGLICAPCCEAATMSPHPDETSESFSAE
jgi:hypothetical protein